VPKADLTTATVGTVSPCVTSTGQVAACGAATQMSPAAKAGLAHGDRVTAVGATSVTDWQSLTKALHALAPGQTATLTYTNPAGVSKTTSVVPLKSTSTDSSGKKSTGGVIGISASFTQHYNPISAVGYSGTEFWTAIKASFQGIGAIPASVPKLFTSTVNHTQRSLDSPVSVIGLAQVGGSLFGAAGFAALFSIIATFNVFFGVFNLLPILPLDGGHIAVLLYEQVRKGVYRLMRKAAPGRVDLNKLMPVAYAFLLVFVCLIVLTISADITNPLRLPS
jgi:membrane-associated protease RseP (regulator of RpoE activity)